MIGWRNLFWQFAQRAVAKAQERSRKLGIPCNIDAHHIDRLLVDQGWKCAVSGIELMPPTNEVRPFGPSLDRIAPQLGYVAGNVRVVCTIANFAMNKWGEDTLRKFLNEYRTSAEMSHKKIRQR